MIGCTFCVTSILANVLLTSRTAFSNKWCRPTTVALNKCASCCTAQDIIRVVLFHVLRCVRAGRSGSTFGDPAAAGRGDTSAQTQFTKGAGDATKNTIGKALGGDAQTPVRIAEKVHQICPSLGFYLGFHATSRAWQARSWCAVAAKCVSTPSYRACDRARLYWFTFFVSSCIVSLGRSDFGSSVTVLGCQRMMPLHATMLRLERGESLQVRLWEPLEDRNSLKKSCVCCP